MVLKIVRVRSWEAGLLFRNGDFHGVLGTGRHVFFDPLMTTRVDVVDRRKVLLSHDLLDVIATSGKLGHHAKVLNLEDHRRVFVWADNRLHSVLGKGRYVLWEGPKTVRVIIADKRDVFLERGFDRGLVKTVVESGLVTDETEVLDLTDRQRALVWVDGRLHAVLGPGLHVYWKGPGKVRVEIVDTDSVRFVHKDLPLILKSAEGLLRELHVPEGHRAVVFLNGAASETLGPGFYAFWEGVARLDLNVTDMREGVLDVTGQEVMTSDKVSLRVNLVVSRRVTDPVKALGSVTDHVTLLYRHAQLALRAAIVERDLDTFLKEREAVSTGLFEALAPLAREFGVEVISVGIRDVILPGEMRTLLNSVTEARKAAEADLITRREQTAAMRSQANTAKILENNPALMRMRELETLERIAQSGQLKVMLSDKGLADRLLNLL